LRQDGLSTLLSLAAVVVRVQEELLGVEEVLVVY
jgi:hypothetical protein